MRPHTLLLVACLLAGISFAFGQNIYYVTQNGAGAKDGTDWADAFDSTAFRSVLKTANYGTVFWLAAGTYTPGNGRDSSFTIPSGVKLYGGFPTTGNPTFADRDIAANATTLSGETGSIAANDNCYHVVQLKYADSTTILDGLTISGGYANGSNENANGGGIYNDGSFSPLIGSSPLIANCTIINNYANGNGGGIYNRTQGGKANPKIYDCIFQNNSGTALYNDGGGGICNATVNRCSFKSNQAPIGSAVYNAGRFGGSNYSTFTNCLFVGNKATNKATIYCDGQNGGSGGQSYCIVTITNCSFINDSCVTAGGPSIISNYTYNSGVCSTNVVNCILWNNTLPLIYNYPNGGGTTTNISYSDIQGGYTGTGNIALDPMFIDLYHSDYHLASCSPCVNTGTALGAPNMDMDSVMRPIKGAYDMGAYESKDTGIIAASVDITVSPNDTFCSNVNALFTAVTNTPTPAYRWQVNGITTGTSSPTFVSSTLNSGDVVSCKITSTASCLASNNAADTLRVYVKPAAVAGFTYTNSGNSYDFTDASTHAINIKWLFGDGDSSTAANPTHNYATGSSYTATLIAYNDCGADTFSRIIDLSTGINEAMGQELEIYPNPTAEKLYITIHASKPESVKIYDLTGLRVYETEYKPVIDIKGLSSGVYTIELKTAGKGYRQKFIKL